MPSGAKHNPVLRRVAPGVFVALAVSAVLSAQQPASAPPAPTFRAEANFVEVNAIVTDEQNRPVPNLAAADFTILEDGAPQPIGAFGTVNVPIAAPDRMAPAIDTDVHSNLHAAARVYLIVLDSYQTDRLRTDRVKAAARQFVERALGPEDIAAVVHTTEPADFNQWFTDSRRLLLASIDRFSGRQAQAVARPGRDAPPADDITPRDAPDDPIELERASHARSSLNTLHKLMDAMAGVRGRRKALILFSEGFGYDVRGRNNTGAAALVTDAFDQTAGATAAAGVSVYAIDPHGLGAADAPASGDSLAQRSLQLLAEGTGGFAALTTRDTSSAFDRIVVDNSAYYVLGYRPTNERRDGRFRRIDVRMNRPGLRVRARTGYIAPGGRAPATKPATATVAALGSAASSLLPMTGVPMTVFAAPFKDTASNAAVLLFLELPPAYFANVAADDAAAKDTLEVSLSAFDGNGNLKAGKRHTFNLALTSRSIDDAKRLGFRMLSQMQIPPGRYQLRVASADANAAAGPGNVLYDLDVPDFFKAPLAMSGIAMYSWPEPPARLSTSAPAPMTAILPWPPTMQREFTRSDELALFAEVYENPANAQAHPIEITTTLRDASGRVVAQDREERSSAEPRGHRGEHGLQARIPLRDAIPGRYILHMEVVARTGNAPRVSRDIPITVN